MRILIVGVLDIDWSTNCSMQHALEDLGHTVVPFNYRTVTETYYSKGILSNTLLDRLTDKVASFLRSARSPLTLHWYYLRKGRKIMNWLLIETVNKGDFDLVILSKTDTVDYGIIPELNKHASTWYFFMDPMDQAIRINAREYAVRSTWASATFSDVTEHFKKAGATAYWITQGVDAEVFSGKDVAKVYDVVFIGTKNVERDKYITALKHAGFSVACFGEGWENLPVYHKELVNIYRQSHIVLNFCRPGSGFSIRVFQVMGSGAFMLTEYCTDLEEFFKRGEELDWFKSKAVMIEKTGMYLNDKAKLNKIAEKGCHLVHNKYSWKKNMSTIMDIAKKKD